MRLDVSGTLAGSSNQVSTVSNPELIDNAQQLREHYGKPSELAVACMFDEMDRFHRQFISLSPLLCIATADAEGQPFVSPKGDAPGFVEVLDSRTLIIPDRIGNNKVESLSNLVANPKLGLIFFVPGIRETLRVRGQAQLVRDTATLERFKVGRALPKSGILVEVTTVYFHCGKAMVRSKLWDATQHAPAEAMPSFGRIVKHQQKLEQSAGEMEAHMEDAYSSRLY